MNIFIRKVIILHLLFMVCFSKRIKAQGIYLPSGAFHAWVQSHYPSCVYPDESIDITCSAIVNEDSLDLSGLNIFNFNGLQYFTSLIYLDVSHNTSGGLSGGDNLPVPNSVKVLKCSNENSPTFVLESLPAGLEYLDCSENATAYSTEFDHLPALPATLKYLNCSGNTIRTAIAVPPLMDTLICSNNGRYVGPGFFTGITSLSALPSTLKYLDCSGNVLTTLPSLPASLTYLDCSNNAAQGISGGTTQYVGGLTVLPVLPSNLVHLACGGNYIPGLPALPSTLEYFSCEYLDSAHSITLPAFPQKVRYINVNGNDLASLSALPDSLRKLYCSGNANLACLPVLPPFMTDLECYNTKINCIPNSVNGLTATVTRLCSPVNNSNQCQAFPLLSGHVFYDNNSNGIKESLENYRSGVEIQLSNGLDTYSDITGFYNVTADTGVNILTVFPPNYYNAVPATVNFSMPLFTSVATRDIALQPAVNVDSISISVVPVSFARPGFDQYYNISYENVGTTTVSPATVFHYDNTRLTFISASNPGVIDNGNSLNLSEANFTPGQRGSYTATFNIKPTAIAGDTIFVNVKATANSAVATDSSYSVITASLDPNDKQATPKLTPQQLTSAYIDYIIRFQNTGTDTAFNIVVTDTLSSQLDITSFQVLNTSHPCKTTRKGNAVVFEFLNVLLPDMNTNEPLSHGFIRFRVKPLETVPVNSIILNTAAIYFDYNTPVLTNVTNTSIGLAAVPLNLLFFKALTDAADNALLYWNTANEINTASFEVEQSIDGVLYTNIGKVNAKRSGDNKYTFKSVITAGIVYYRLKIIDIDGRFTYSPVVRVKKNKHAETIVVLSNPAKNILSIMITDPLLTNISANIVSEHGITVKRFLLKNGSQHIDVTSLSAGIYYLRTTAVTKKIIINH